MHGFGDQLATALSSCGPQRNLHRPSVGSLFGAVFLLCGLGQGSLAHFRDAPWYTYLGGVLSVAIVYLVAASISKVGVASATTAIIVGQVVTAAAVDYFGWFGLEPLPFSIWKGLGILLWQGAPGCYCPAEGRRNFPLVRK